MRATVARIAATLDDAPDGELVDDPAERDRLHLEPVGEIDLADAGFVGQVDENAGLVVGELAAAQPMPERPAHQAGHVGERKAQACPHHAVPSDLVNKVYYIGGPGRARAMRKTARAPHPERGGRAGSVTAPRAGFAASRRSSRGRRGVGSAGRRWAGRWPPRPARTPTGPCVPWPPGPRQAGAPSRAPSACPGIRRPTRATGTRCRNPAHGSRARGSARRSRRARSTAPCTAP